MRHRTICYGAVAEICGQPTPRGANVSAALSTSSFPNRKGKRLFGHSPATEKGELVVAPKRTSPPRRPPVQREQDMRSTDDCQRYDQRGGHGHLLDRCAHGVPPAVALASSLSASVELGCAEAAE